MSDRRTQDEARPEYTGNERAGKDLVCPVCGAPLAQEKCKVVCRSERCVYRIVYNCAEF